MIDKDISQRARLEFKAEDENEDGVVIGPLTYANGEPVFDDGRWVSKTAAIRIARSKGADLFEY